VTARGTLLYWLALGCLAAACAAGERSTEPRDGAGVEPGPAAAPAAEGGLSIDFRSEPAPPRAGSNTFVVTVKQPDGTPLVDGAVAATFSMPAMPSMNMPAMRSTATLAHEAAGRYRGTGELSMGGTWNVTITVSRGAEELGRRRLSIVAKGSP
jgi:hypothetical protein